MTGKAADVLAALRQKFRNELNDRLSEIQGQFERLDPEKWDAGALAVLHRQVHGLTGTAGTFGMQSVSEAARELERKLAALSKSGVPPTAAAWLEMAPCLDRLSRLAVARPIPQNLGLEQPAQMPRTDKSPLVFIVEDDAEQGAFLSGTLAENGYSARLFSSPEDVQRVLESSPGDMPAAVIMDLVFPSGDLAGAEAIAELGFGRESAPPVIVVSIRDDFHARLAALRAGACRYLQKPVSPSRLIDLLDTVTGRQPAQPYRVMLMDDDPLLLDAQAAVLRSAGMEVRTIGRPSEIVDAVDDFRPDVMLLDVYMPDATGPELAAVLRERDSAAQTPILFLSAETDITRQLLALNLGGDDFLVKPIDPEHLVAAVTARARRARQSAALRHRLELTLYEREREHVALDAHAIVSIADSRGSIIYVNDKFCGISGYSREELIGQNHRMLKSGRHPPEFYRDVWRTISSGRVWQGEICNRRKDGSFYWVESTIVPLVGQNGRPYQYVSIRTDITRVKSTELALQASEARLGFLLAKSPIAIYSCSVQPPYAAHYVSDSVKRQLGYEPDAFTSSGRFWADNLHPEDRERTLAGLSGILECDSYSHEYRFRAADGTYRWLHDELVVVRDDAGTPKEIVGCFMDISDRKMAEMQAESSRERLRRGQLYANIGTWEWHIQTGDLFWTERIAPLFGYPAGDLETSYENFLKAVHPDDRQAVIDAVNACVERNVPYEIEHRVVWPDGTVRWLLERGAVRRDADGTPLQMLGVVQDIDDRKCAEIALAERERQLRDAQRMAKIGHWRADLETGELFWSEEICRIFGREPGGFAPSVAAFKAAVHPDDRAAVEASEKMAERTGRHDVVHRIVRPDGTVRHIHELAQLETGRTGKWLTGLVQDVTDEIVAREQLRESERALKQLAWERGERVKESTCLSGIMQLLLDDRLDDDAVLEAAVAVIPSGWKVPEDTCARIRFGGRTFATAGFRETAWRQREDIPLAQEGVHDITVCRLDPSETGAGEGPFLKEEDALLRNIAGQIGQAMARRSDQRALVAARDEAHRANQAKSDFLSSMSHELRTPMNAILGFGQLLELDGTPPEEQKDNAHEIVKAGRHLLSLINEVLDLAKVESGRIDLSLEAVELLPAIEECIGFVSPQAKDRGISLQQRVPGGLAMRADRVRLKQVLINLLSNAVKYNRHGGSVSVTASRAADSRIRLSVSDTGNGIPSEKIAGLFEPFNRLDAEKSDIEGTGIGLTITRRLVEMMGGGIEVESEVGVGSRFAVVLPADAVQDRNAAASDGHESAVSGRPAEAHEHLVLYIEDNPSNIKLVANVLGRRAGLQLITAHTPELGLETALQRRPAVILLDINMPGMDGYQLLRVIKAHPEIKDTPCIALTANAMPRDIRRGLEAGFVDYLTKPVDVDLLRRTVERYLAAAPGGRG